MAGAVALVLLAFVSVSTIQARAVDRKARTVRGDMTLPEVMAPDHSSNSLRPLSVIASTAGWRMRRSGEIT